MLPVVFVLLGLFGQQYHWLMTTPLQGSQRRVILADAYGFGTCYERAKQFRMEASKHSQDADMFHRVWLWNGSNAAFQWRQEAEWRWRCWDVLEDALNTNLSPTMRLERLESLYDMLGCEMYWAWAMPCPTPQYRVRQ